MNTKNSRAIDEYFDGENVARDSLIEVEEDSEKNPSKRDQVGISSGKSGEKTSIGPKHVDTNQSGANVNAESTKLEHAGDVDEKVGVEELTEKSWPQRPVRSIDEQHEKFDNHVGRHERALEPEIDEQRHFAKFGIREDKKTHGAQDQADQASCSASVEEYPVVERLWYDLKT